MIINKSKGGDKMWHHGIIIAILFTSTVVSAVEEQSWRLVHPTEGVVRVWHPAYEGELEGIVVFAHGDWSSADHMWNKIKIQNQLRESGRKALFILPTGPKKGSEPVRWKDNLQGLIRFALRKTKLRPPPKVTLMSHSNGYRTIATWFSYRAADTIILSDSFFGFSKGFHRWLRLKKGRQIIFLVAKRGLSSRRWAKPFAGRYPDTEYFSEVPAKLPDYDPKPKVIYIETSLPHKAILRSGKALPVVLKGLSESSSLVSLH